MCHVFKTKTYHDLLDEVSFTRAWPAPVALEGLYSFGDLIMLRNLRNGVKFKKMIAYGISELRLSFFPFTENYIR